MKTFKTAIQGAKSIENFASLDSHILVSQQF